MRILVLGAGGVGGYFGARLLQGGADVTFLVRPRRAAQLASEGLRIESPLGDAKLAVRTITAEATQPEFDLVLLTCKAYDLDAAIAAIEPALAPAATILPLLNGISHLDVLNARFGGGNVLGGVARIGATLSDDGVVRHLDDAQDLVYGEQDGLMSTRVARIGAVLSQAPGMAAIAVADIMRQMWQKLAYLGTLASLACLLRANVGEAVRGAPEGAALLRTLFEQLVEVARRAGHPPTGAFVTWALRGFAEPASRDDASMLRDLEAGGRVEAEHITGFLLRRVREVGLDDTILTCAYAHLKAYEQRRDARRLPGGRT